MNARRRTLGAGVALLTAAFAGGASARPRCAPIKDADAELVALADRISACVTEGQAIWEPFQNTVYEQPTPEEQARSQALVAEGHELAERIANTPALTMAGVRAKAKALMCYSGYDEVALAAHGSWWSGNDELLGWSIARDVLTGSIKE